MKSQVQELLRTALSLPDADRAEIAGSLIQSLDSQADDDVESAWSAEIKRRLEAIDSGSVALISWDDVMGELLRARDA
ncbi:MAG: addiction module protein [Planctomycetota bacterium]|nr:addiction module protein [Planctomycetota bacterium]